MKKITLLFALLLVTFSWQANAQYFTEDFEVGVVPPANWTATQTNVSETWKLNDDSAHGGTYAAQCQYDVNVLAQDETIMTPVIDLTNATIPVLSFWFDMSYYWAVDPNDNYDLKVQATIDGGSTFIDLWSEADYGVFANFTWYEQKINLSAYAGTNNLQLVFRYVGIDGAQALIDDISVYEGPAAAPSCVSNLVPADAGTLSISTTGDATLTWDETVETDGYHVSIGTTAGTYTTTVDVTTNSYSATGLTDATTYYWLVVPYNMAGDAIGCAEQSFTTQTAVAPNCAENLVPADAATGVTILSGRKVSFSWDAPSTGAAPTSYTLEIGVASGTYDATIDDITDTQITLGGAVENTTYFWKITPMNLDIPAVGCAEQSFTTDALPALANDDCSGAIPLTLGADACDTPTVVDNSFAHDSGQATPSCASYSGSDVWFSVTVPTSGSVTIESSAVAGSSLSDTGMAAYSGTCGSLTEIACADDINYPSNAFSKIELTGQTTGDVLYVRVWEYGNNAFGEFNVCAWDPSASAISENKIDGFKFYPNPVNNTLNLSAQNNIENVIIYNISGQEVIAITPNSLQTQVDMSRLQNGIYFVKAQINGQLTAFKVVKK